MIKSNRTNLSISQPTHINFRLCIHLALTCFNQHCLHLKLKFRLRSKFSFTQNKQTDWLGGQHGLFSNWVFLQTLLPYFVFCAGTRSVKFIFFIIITLIHKSRLSLTEHYCKRIQIRTQQCEKGNIYIKNWMFDNVILQLKNMILCIFITIKKCE